MSRDTLKAYMTLRTSHKELHKVLRAMEEEATDSEILRRLELVQESLNQARSLFEVSKPTLSVLEKAS